MPDRFDAMRAFITVCDEGGFAPAARRLRLAPSIVTRLVASLEEHLGARLLQRTTRSVHLTDAGGRFLERARRILADMEEAERAAQAEAAEPRGRLVVSAPLLFGRLHVAPLLSRYLARYPNVRAELLLSDRFAHLVEEGIDVAIRIGVLADSSLIARRLGETRRILVASPGYLAVRGGGPEHPADLARYDVIAPRPLILGSDWSFQAPDGAELRIALEPRLDTNSNDAAIAHAVAGGGIAAVFCYQVEAEIRGGALVQILPGFVPPAVPIHAVFASARQLSSTLRAFLDLMEQERTAARLSASGA